MDKARDRVRDRPRLDVLLVEKGLAESREKAQALVMAGLVTIDDAPAEKPGQRVSGEASLKVKGPAMPYVSRGGLKLDAALREFGTHVDGVCALDIGSSTGGFVDCLLQHGARKVYAVDVGHGQLHQKIRQDPRVVCLEGKNARYLKRDDIPEKPALVTLDVSFISLTKVIPAVVRVCGGPFELLALVKPQFEAGRGQVPKGVVRSRDTHRRVLRDISAHLTGEGFCCLGLVHSPIKGPRGNIEFLLSAVYGRPAGSGLSPGAIEAAVEKAHSSFQCARAAEGDVVFYAE